MFFLLFFALSFLFSSFFPDVMGKYVLMQKQIILTSEKHAECPFAGQNTQHSTNHWAKVQKNSNHIAFNVNIILCILSFHALIFICQLFTKTTCLPILYCGTQSIKLLLHSLIIHLWYRRVTQMKDFFCFFYFGCVFILVHKLIFIIIFDLKNSLFYNIAILISIYCLLSFCIVVWNRKR